MKIRYLLIPFIIITIMILVLDKEKELVNKEIISDTKNISYPFFSNDNIDNYISDFLNDFTNNKPYLFHGKGLIEKRKKELVIPYFLIQRDRMEKVLKQIDDYPLQIIAGRSFSGKTYSISELSRRIKNRTIYFFSSKERLTYDAFKSLMEKNNSVIFVDSNVLSRNQMELIFMNLYNLHRSNIRACSH